MNSLKLLQKHEKKLVDRVAREIIEIKPTPGWRKWLFPPLVFYDFFRMRKGLMLTRKNLMFTRKMALKAAKGIVSGNGRAEELRRIEEKTRRMLGSETRGVFTEKIRRRQIREIEILTNHYVAMITAGGSRYDDMVRNAYANRQAYMDFLESLQYAEQHVIRAAVASVRKGSRAERLRWFGKVSASIQKARLMELDRLFPGS